MRRPNALESAKAGKASVGSQRGGVPGRRPGCGEPIAARALAAIQLSKMAAPNSEPQQRQKPPERQPSKHGKHSGQAGRLGEMATMGQYCGGIAAACEHRRELNDRREDQRPKHHRESQMSQRDRCPLPGQRQNNAGKQGKLG